jgi:hypothetical protein
MTGDRPITKNLAQTSLHEIEREDIERLTKREERLAR